MSKHTPGPWIIIKDNGYFDIISKYGDEVIGCEGCGNKDDARLIAAAPDLLEALELYALSYSDEELVQLAECTSGMGEISPVTAKREIIRRVAIAKAKGEQP